MRDPNPNHNPIFEAELLGNKKMTEDLTIPYSVNMHQIPNSKSSFQERKKLVIAGCHHDKNYENIDLKNFNRIIL